MHCLAAVYCRCRCALLAQVVPISDYTNNVRDARCWGSDCGNKGAVAFHPFLGAAKCWCQLIIVRTVWARKMEPVRLFRLFRLLGNAFHWDHWGSRQSTAGIVATWRLHDHWDFWLAQKLVWHCPRLALTHFMGNWSACKCHIGELYLVESKRMRVSSESCCPSKKRNTWQTCILSSPQCWQVRSSQVNDSRISPYLVRGDCLCLANWKGLRYQR